MAKIIEGILIVPAIAAVVGIAVVEVVHVYKYVKSQLSKD